MKGRFITPVLLLAPLLTAPAFAQQSSATVTAGNLTGRAETGPVSSEDRPSKQDQASNQMGRRMPSGRTDDDTRNCSRGVTVQSGNGSASASVSTSPGGNAVVAAGGSPGSTTKFFGCEGDTNTDSDRSHK